MFKFLKSLLNPKEEIEEIQLSFENLSSWFEKQAQAIMQDFGTDLSQASSDFDQKKTSITESTKELESAKLRNPNIPERAKHFMEGNRATFIRFTKQFIERVHIPSDASSFEDFTKEFESALAQYTKATQRPFAILQEFFANESRKVAELVKSIETIIIRLKSSYESKGLTKIQEVRNKCKGFENKKAAYHSHALEKASKKEELVRQKKKAAELSEQHASILKSDEYKELQSLGKIKDNLDLKRKEKELELFHHFSVLETALRKYERIALNHSDLITEYLMNHLKTLQADEELIILEILNGLRNALQKGSIDIKDKKKSKTEQQIESLSKDYLTTFRKSYGELLFDLQDVQQKIIEHKTKSSLEVIEKDLKDTEHNIANIHKRISDLDERMNSFDESKLKNELLTAISHVTKKKIVLI